LTKNFCRANILINFPYEEVIAMSKPSRRRNGINLKNKNPVPMKQ